MAASHSNTLNFSAPLNQIRQILLDNSFCSTLNLSLKSENPSPTGVWYRFHHGVTFTSWGEKITITLTPVTPSITSVNVHSECGMPTQVIDWGKNQQVVCNILEYIERMVPRSNGNTFHPAPYPNQMQTTNAPNYPPHNVANNVPNYAPNYSPNNIPPQPQMATDKKFCSQCGKQIPVAANFCSFCGSKQG